MKNKFLKLALFCQRFGFFHGIKIVSKTFFSKKNNLVSIKLPEIKYPIFIRAKSSDEFTFQQIFVKLEYNFATENYPENIIDAGSNTGLAAIYFANKYPDAKIFCFEPEASNFSILEKNISNYKNIIALKKGVWDKSTYLKVVDPGLDNWGFTVTECSFNTPGAIESVSITDMMHEYSLSKLNIVKMDIEGSEKEVLTASNVHDWLSKTDVLIIELHDRMKEGTSKAFFNALTPYKSTIDIIGENIICHITK